MPRKPSFTTFEQEFAKQAMLSNERARELARVFMWCVAKLLLRQIGVTIHGYGSFSLYRTVSRNLMVNAKGGGRRMMKTTPRISVKYYPGRSLRDALAGVPVQYLGMSRGAIDIEETKIRKALLSIEKD